MKKNRLWKKIRLLVFLLGVFLSILGWFIDRSTSFPIFIKFVAPECIEVKNALEQLESGKINVINENQPAFHTIIKWWHPATPLKFRKEATCIRKGQAVIGNGKTYYLLQLCMYNGKKNLNNFYWPSYDLKKRIQTEIDKALTRWGSVTFFGGLLLSSIMALFEYSR